MNPTILISIVLTVVLVVMFAIGLYSLNKMNRPRPAPPAPAAPAAASTAPKHPVEAAGASFTPGETIEWDANAHRHEHCAHPTSSHRDDLRDASEPLSQRPSPDAQNTDDLEHELHEALARETHDASASFDSASRVNYAETTSPSSGSMSRCPQCRSSRIDTFNRARKAGSTIGSVAGATGGMTAALAGAETGAVAGAVLGPVGSLFGGLAGAVIAGLLGSAAGCAAGSAVGAAIDDNVLDNNVCLSCGHTFSAARS
ncbi:hypothetical protein [Paraburkholderia terricola]|uniref:hypothetical protein n=1 Tax=Paraburkholderia terricola TaxID=169427 RepID=UPI001FC91737|nr:hypothetical protein [Paraburkholderia terricola]